MLILLYIDMPVCKEASLQSSTNESKEFVGVSDSDMTGNYAVDVFQLMDDYENSTMAIPKYNPAPGIGSLEGASSQTLFIKIKDNKIIIHRRRTV